MELVDDELDRFRSYLIYDQPGLNIPLWVTAADRVSLVIGPNGRMLRPFAGLPCVYGIDLIDSAVQEHKAQLLAAAQQARPAAAQQARPAAAAAAAAAAAEPVDGKPAITLSVRAADKIKVPPLVKNLHPNPHTQQKRKQQHQRTHTEGEHTKKRNTHTQKRDTQREGVPRQLCSSFTLCITLIYLIDLDLKCEPLTKPMSCHHERQIGRINCRHGSPGQGSP